MKAPESIPLSDVIRQVSQPRYVLGTTYTLSLAFFESVVFPYIDRTHLKQCLILCDRLGYQRSLDEGAALIGAGQDYMVVPAPMSEAFHAKVWLLIGEGEGVLLVGSGNLTQSGFMNNAELFEALHFTKENPAADSMLTSLRGFVQGLAGMWASSDSKQMLCTEILGHIHDALDQIPAGAAESSSPRFIHSFAGPMIGQLPEAANATDLMVAAPYFGNSTAGLDLLAARYNRAQMRIFPAVHTGDSTDLPLANVKQVYKSAAVSKLNTGKKNHAFAHLKLYGIASGNDSAWLCCTSANCTRGALQGQNVEAGIVRAVARKTLDDYFVADKATLPSGVLTYKTDASVAGQLFLSASDTGNGLDLSLASLDAKRLPLRDVELTVRTGSHLSVCTRASLFTDSHTGHLLWTAFDGWKRQRKATVCLYLQGTDAHGKAVRGACFVENRMLLTADPIHRSAWRGALALLDSEGAPELADIAAVFTLARDLFDGNLVRVPVVEHGSTDVPAKRDNNMEPEAIAVWPPQPDTHELHRKLGTTGAGQLQWFQKILGALLRNEAAGDHAESKVVDTGGDDADRNVDSTFSEPDKKESAKLARSAAERLWLHARDKYDKLSSRLMEICPSAQQATNLWPATLFMLLSTLAVLRAAQRMAPDLNLGTAPDVLCDEFLILMLHPRKQRDDYWPPEGFRYRGDVFPVLGADLRSTYNVNIHRDMSTVMLAIVTDKKMRSPPGYYTEMWKRYLGIVSDPAFHPDPDFFETCLRTWRRFICGASRPETDDEFKKSFDALWSQR